MEPFLKKKDIKFTYVIEETKPRSVATTCRDTTEEAKREKRKERLPEGLSLVREGVASPLVTVSVGEKS